MKSTLLAVLLGFAAAPVSATILYSSFGPEDSYDADNGVQIGEPNNTEVAVSFIPTFDTNLHSLRLAVEDFESVPNEFTVSVSASDGGLPGTPLETFNVAFPFPTAIVTITSTLNPALLTGVTYWVVVAAVDPTQTQGEWHNNDQGLVGYHYRDLKSGGWASFAAATPALEVNSVDGVPEPWSFFLASTGLALLLLRRRTA